MRTRKPIAAIIAALTLAALPASAGARSIGSEILVVNNTHYPLVLESITNPITHHREPEWEDGPATGSVLRPGHVDHFPIEFGRIFSVVLHYRGLGHQQAGVDFLMGHDRVDGHELGCRFEHHAATHPPRWHELTGYDHWACSARRIGRDFRGSVFGPDNPSESPTPPNPH
jgi:hypothetical protein